MSGSLPEIRPRSSSNQQNFNNSELVTNESGNDLSRQLSILKHRKKQASNDAQLLLNRIALLQKEEERARRKIEQTKDKACEILNMRDENFKRVEKFVMAAEEEHLLQVSLHEKNLSLDNNIRDKRLKQSSKVLNQRKSAVNAMREKKKVNENMMLDNLTKELEEKQRRRDKVKQEEEERRLKKERLKAEAERKKHELFLRKAMQEEDEARKAEALVQQLEAKEKEWLQKLQGTKQVQENAYGYLENALMNDYHNIGTLTGQIKNGATSSHDSPSKNKETNALIHHSTSVRSVKKPLKK